MYSLEAFRYGTREAILVFVFCASWLLTGFAVLSDDVVFLLSVVGLGPAFFERGFGSIAMWARVEDPVTHRADCTVTANLAKSIKS